MESHETQNALDVAVTAAKAAGALMLENRHHPKKMTSTTQHDIKLELDVQCQETIEAILRAHYPEAFILGEEGDTGDREAPYRWVIDPIDGTVNFTYDIPHACVSIALQQEKADPGADPERYETILGVVYDPFANELWTAIRGEPAYLNGQPIHVSDRRQLGEAIVSIGFSKDRTTLDQMLPVLHTLAYEVRKIRIMGAAALAMVYVASGRFDGYVENHIRLWDIAAGGLIVECAGGRYWRRATPAQEYQIIVSNDQIHEALEEAYQPNEKLTNP